MINADMIFIAKEGYMINRLLLDAYTQPHRHYHNLTHIQHCLMLLYEMPFIEIIGDHNLSILEHAIWWHDVVYDPLRNDNEENSVIMFTKNVDDISNSIKAEVEKLILLTKNHQAEAHDLIGGIFVSIDLAILGEEPVKYQGYVDSLRKEYSHVTEEEWRQNRLKFLTSILLRKAIFPHIFFYNKYEGQAKKNIYAELSKLFKPL